MTDSQIKYIDKALSRAKRLGVQSETTRSVSEAMQFPTKREAAEFAKLIGWQKNDALERHIFGIIVWVISDPHLNFATAILCEKLCTN